VKPGSREVAAQPGRTGGPIGTMADVASVSLQRTLSAPVQRGGMQPRCRIASGTGRIAEQDAAGRRQLHQKQRFVLDCAYSRDRLDIRPRLAGRDALQRTLRICTFGRNGSAAADALHQGSALQLAYGSRRRRNEPAKDIGSGRAGRRPVRGRRHRGLPRRGDR